jgi:SpoVK/Ycf46/Vps4 family AAA+-type ATPase
LLSATTSSTARAREARFISDVLVPFVSRLLDRAEAHTDDDPQALVEAFAHDARQLQSAPAVLANALGLDATDLALMALAVAPYLEPRVGVRYRELQKSVLDDRLTVASALDLLGFSSENRYLQLERFQPEKALFRDGVLALEIPAGLRGDAIVDRLLCAPQRTIDRMLGWPRIDERIRSFCALEAIPIPLESVILPEKARRDALALVRHHHIYRESVRRLGFARAIPYGRGVNLLFAGPPGTGKTMFARAIAHSLKKPLLRVYADRVAESQDAVEPIILGLFREAALHDAVLFFDECEGLFSKRSSRLAFLLAELEHYEGIAILATNTPEALDAAMDRRIMCRVDFDVPGVEDRLQIWELHLPPEAPVADDVDLALLAGLFAFPGGAIKNAVLVALNRAIDRNPRNPVLDMATLRKAAEAQLQFNLEELAHKSRITLTLEDLVLPADDRARIQEIIEACASREFVQNKWGFGKRLVTGKGICILFDGPPGTGKTLCAEILASAVDRALYRIDVANVVSKWMGETEKNIAAIFRRARATQAILLFDEADSLFARRTEVQSSNDRFANQEVNLLLQEVERFDGIVILTTNFFGGLDDALKRRIQYRVTFPKPGPDERARIWRTLIPKEAPLAGDVDFEKLADAWEFAGGNIKNAVLRAAYKAAADGNVITMDHLVTAARRESEACGMLFREIAPKSSGDRFDGMSIEQLEKNMRARAAWEAEARRLFAAQIREEGG